MRLKFFKAAVFIVAFVALSYFLKELKSIAVPIVFGGVFGFIFSSVVEWLKGKHVAASLTIPITVIFFIAVSAAAGFMLFGTATAFFEKFGVYQKKSTDLIIAISNRVPFLQETALVEVQNRAFSMLTTSILSVSRSVLGFVSGFVLSLFTMLFVLLERNFLHVKLNAMFPNSKNNRGMRIYRTVENMNEQVSKFILLKALISCATGLIVYTGFAITGVDFPLMWGALTMVLNFIPSVGSIVITLVSILFSFVQFYPQWGPIIAVVFITISAQVVIGSVLDPLITGEQLNLSPLIIFGALLYWGWVWGPAGMLLAVPLSVILQVVCKSFGITAVSTMLENARMIQKRQKAKKIRK